MRYLGFTKLRIISPKLVEAVIESNWKQKIKLSK